MIIIAIAFIVALAILIPTATSLAHKNTKLSNYLGTIKEDSKEAQFSINVENDYSYFYSNNDGKIVPDKSKFDKLSKNEVKKLKLYYSTYKNKETEEDKKTQSQKDYEELLKLNNEDKNLSSFLDDYSEGLIIFGLVVASGLAIFMVIGYVITIWDEIRTLGKITKDIVTIIVELLVDAGFALLIFYTTVR